MANQRANTTGPQKKQTALRLDPKLLKLIDKAAADQRTSRTSVIEQCLDAGLPRLQKMYKEFHEKD